MYVWASVHNIMCYYAEGSPLNEPDLFSEIIIERQSFKYLTKSDENFYATTNI